MILLIESAPSVFKVARLEAGRPVGVDTLGGGSAASEPPWASALARIDPTPAAVYVANSAGPVLAQRMAEWIRRAWRVEPTFVPGSTGTGRLPLDRALAIEGARARYPLPAVVITADITVGVDCLDGQGERTGSWTLPGERLMREALYAQTSGIAAAALLDAPASEGHFGINTAGAVTDGARLALAAAVATLVAPLASATVLATGRLAADAIRLLPEAPLLCKDLVLEGLAQSVAGA